MPHATIMDASRDAPKHMCGGAPASVYASARAALKIQDTSILFEIWYLELDTFRAKNPPAADFLRGRYGKPGMDTRWVISAFVPLKSAEQFSLETCDSISLS